MPKRGSCMTRAQGRFSTFFYILAAATALAAVLLLIFAVFYVKPTGEDKNTDVVPQTSPDTTLQTEEYIEPTTSSPDESETDHQGTDETEPATQTYPPVVPAPDSSSTVLVSPDNYELVVATAYVNIRIAPSTDSTILSVLAEGGAVLRDRNVDGWSRIYFNGRTAFVYSKYLVSIG